MAAECGGEDDFRERWILLNTTKTTKHKDFLVSWCLCGEHNHELGSTIDNAPIGDGDILDPSRHCIAPWLLGGFLKMAMEVSRGSRYRTASGIASNGFGILHP